MNGLASGEKKNAVNCQFWVDALTQPTKWRSWRDIGMFARQICFDSCCVELNVQRYSEPVELKRISLLHSHGRILYRQHRQEFSWARGLGQDAGRRHWRKHFLLIIHVSDWNSITCKHVITATVTSINSYYWCGYGDTVHHAWCLFHCHVP